MSEYADTFSGIYIVLEKLITEAMKDVGTSTGCKIIEDALPGFRNAAVDIAGVISIMEAYDKQRVKEDKQ